jgi:hypothetical protein
VALRSPSRPAARFGGCLLRANEAEGGAGGGGAGGNGQGGGLFVDAGTTATVSNCSVVGNAAEGGEGEGGGGDGQGVAGGVYNLGTFTANDATVIRPNRASTSNDDNFGI